MSELVTLRAELEKLSRVTGLPVKKLEHLGVVGSTALRAFRYQVIDQIFAYNETRLRNLAAASKLVPVPIMASLAPIYFEPKMCAAMAGLVDQDKAVKLMSKLPLPFLTDCAPFVDPRKIGGIAANIPPKLTALLAPALMERGEHITLGQFIDYVTPEILDATLPVLDDVSLLKIATVAENKDKLNDIIPLVWQRVPSIYFAAAENNMWADALNLLTDVSPELQVKLIDMAAQMPDTIFSSLIKAVHKEGLYSLLLPSLSIMSRSSRQRFARIRDLNDKKVLTAMADSANETDGWVGSCRWGRTFRWNRRSACGRDVHSPGE